MTNVVTTVNNRAWTRMILPFDEDLDGSVTTTPGTNATNNRADKIDEIQSIYYIT